MCDRQTSYWNDTSVGLRSVELRAAGFDPGETAKRNAIVTIASPYTSPFKVLNY